MTKLLATIAIGACLLTACNAAPASQAPTPKADTQGMSQIVDLGYAQGATLRISLGSPRASQALIGDIDHYTITLTPASQPAITEDVWPTAGNGTIAFTGIVPGAATFQVLAVDGTATNITQEVVFNGTVFAGSMANPTTANLNIPLEGGSLSALIQLIAEPALAPLDLSVGAQDGVAAPQASSDAAPVVAN